LKYHEIKNGRTKKMILKFKTKHEGKSLPSHIWERIYEETGPPPWGVPMLMAMAVGMPGTFVIEGLIGSDGIRKLTIEQIARFPMDLQDIILNLKSGVESSEAIQMSFGEVDENGKTTIHDRITWDD